MIPSSQGGVHVKSPDHLIDEIVAVAAVAAEMSEKLWLDTPELKGGRC